MEFPVSTFDSQAVLDAVPVIAVLIDCQGSVQHLNLHFEQLTGWPRADVLGRDWVASCVPARERDRTGGLIRSALQGAPLVRKIAPILCHSSAQLEIEWSGQLIEGEAGRTRGLLLMGVDVTERVRAEEQLRQALDRIDSLLDKAPRARATTDASQNEDRFRKLVENAPYCIHELDTEGRFTAMNPAGLRMINEADESCVIGRRCLDFVSDEDRPRMAEILRAAQNGQKSECEFSCKNGCFIRSNFVPIVQGKVLGISQDITRQVQIESALSRSEARYRRAERGANDGLWEWKVPSGEVYFSPRYLEMLGYQEGELPTDFASFTEVLHPEEKATVVQTLERRIADGQLIDMEIRLRRKGGDYLWVHTRGVVDYDPSDKPIVVTGTNRDISERKQVAEALQQERDRLRQILDAQFGFVCVLSLEGVVIEVNQTPLQLMGLSRRDVLGSQFWEVGWLQPGTELQVQEAISSAASGTTVRGVFQGRFPGLGRCEIDSSFAPLRDSSGRVVNVIAFGVDITQCVRAVEALRSSEARLNEAQRIAGIGSWELDYATMGLVWSDETYRIFEMNPSEFGASHEAFLSAIHPEDRETVNAAYRRAVETREPYEVVHRVLTADGRVKFVRETCETEYDMAGNPVRSVGTVQDITQRVLAEQALRTSEARLREAHRIARLGAWELDIASQMYWWSDEQYALCGVTPGTAVSQADFLAMVHPEDLSSVLEALEQLMTQGCAQTEYRLIRPDGQVRFMHALASVTWDASGRPDRMHGTNQDITERKQAAYEAQLLRETLAHANRLETLSELASGLAHELNQPLGVISMDASTALYLSENLDCDQLHTCLRRISEQAFRAGEIVRRIRTFIRRDPMPKDAHDINLLVREVLMMLGDHLRHNLVTIQLHLAERLPAVMVDGIQIQQVLVNLVRNADDAMSQVVDTPRVLTIETTASESEIRVAVSDTGCGIDPAIAAKLFFPFQTTKAAGLGLGLVTCRTIIEAHGGRIEAHANSTRGTTFVFTLPVA